MKIEGGNKIWFTSDTHFGHTNIAGPSISSWKSGYRNFESVHEMNRALTDGINNHVAENDTLYFLGDFAFGGYENIPAYRHSIVCQNIHVIAGNHDKHLDKYSHLFSSLQDYLTIKAGGYDIVMFHYAMRVWLGSHKGSLMLYGHCVDMETEILTKDGWKRRENLSKNDFIVTYNISSNMLEYQEAQEIIDIDYSGDVYSIEHAGMNLRQTENHMNLIRACKKSKWHLFPIREVAKRATAVYRVSSKFPQQGVQISDNFLRLYVQINADGSFENRSLVRFHLKKDRKIRRLESLLKDMNIKYSKNLSKTGTCKINFTVPEEISKFSYKPLDRYFVDMNSHQVSIFFEEYKQTDGFSCSKNALQIYSCREAEIDLIQEICARNEFRCSKIERLRRKESGDYYKGWMASINFSQQELFVTEIEKYCKREKAEGERFWCVTVPNHTFVCRRKGKVHITGNSHNSLESSPWGRSMDVGVDSAYALYGEYRPFSLEEVIEILSKRDPKFVDHHNKDTNVR